MPPGAPDPDELADLGSSNLEGEIPGAVLAVEEIDAAVDAEGTIRSGKLAGKSLAAAIWILAVPVLIQQTMQAFVGMADKMFAGQLPADVRVAALDAVGIGSYVGWFIGIAMAGLGIGGQALIARAMGAGDRALGHRALGQAMTLSAAWGVLVAIVLWSCARPVAALCQLTPEATGHYLEYIHTLALGMPFAGVMMVGAMCLHGAGDTTRPSVIAVGVNLVNIAFSWALSGVDVRFGTGADAIFLENPFGFDLYVRGIAAGTAISYLFGAVSTLYVLRRGVKDLRLETADLPLDRSMVWRIVRIGVPNFCEGISMWAVNLFILMLIGMLGANGIEGLQGAHIIAVQWEAFSFLPGFAIGTAAGALAGQYLGAGNPAMAQRAVLTCTAIASLVMGGLGFVFILFGGELTAIISTEPVHLEHVPNLLVIGGAVQVFFAVTMVFRQGLRGVGDTRWTFLITTLSSYAVRLPAAYVLGVAMGFGIEGIWMGLCGELVIRSALFGARFAHGGWKTLKV